MIDDFKFTCAGCGVNVELVGLRAQFAEQDKELKAMAIKLIDKDWPEAQLNLEIARYRDALDLIAAPERPDGTYNRDRKACELLARAALSGKEST